MNRTSAPANARNRSTKSGFMRRSTLQAPELLTEAPCFERALRFGDLLPIGMVLAIGVGRRRESADRHPARPLERAHRRVGHGAYLTNSRTTLAGQDPPLREGGKGEGSRQTASFSR